MTINDKKRKPVRPRKKITATYLHNAGLYYLQRFAASTAQFRKVMTRKIDKSCREHPDQSRKECLALLETLITTFTQTELLNDTVYAKAKIRSLRRKGKSYKAIQAALHEKGVDGALIGDLLAAEDEFDPAHYASPDHQAAAIFARKRRFYDKITKTPETREDQYQKALGAFARGGFGYDVARTTLDQILQDDEHKNVAF